MTAEKSDSGAGHGTQDFFFYGTLCHPGILKRVLGHDCTGLAFQDALLPGYTRHHVRGEDYPAVVSKDQADKIMPNSASVRDEDANTRGTFVRGLSYKDMLSLDIFEGSQYSRVKLQVGTLTSPTRTASLPQKGFKGGILSANEQAAAGHQQKCRNCNEPARPPAPHREGGMGFEGTVLEMREEQQQQGHEATSEGAQGHVKRDSVIESESDEDWEAARNKDTADTDKPESGPAHKSSSGTKAGSTEEAWVYVWSDDVKLLEPQIWEFDQFVKDKAHVWLSASTAEYDEVDQSRKETKEGETRSAPVESPAILGGPESTSDDQVDAPVSGQTMEGYPDFGKNMLKYWNFRDRYVNLNHGSYGSPPKAVVEAMRKLSDQIESCPDLYMRRTYIPELVKVQDQITDLIGAERDEVVITPNATHAINNIVREIEWEKGDIIVMYNTTYGAVGQTLKYICDKHPGVKLHVIDLTFPIAHSEIVAQTEAVFAQYNQVAIPHFSGISKATPLCRANCTRVKMCVVDQIASLPGAIFPWEDIVRSCKKYGVLSLVDAAHAIGQVKTDVKASDPDFWVSNCHKWLLCHRGCAVLYVPVRNQILIRSSMPTSADYESRTYPSPSGRLWHWAKQYGWTGTQDWTPYMTIPAALKFRKSIGGEDRIMAYCHSLAVKGGKRLSKRWGTPVMENSEGTLTAAMVNVALPDVPQPKDLDETFKQLNYFMDGMFKHNAFAPPYHHGGRWWVRCSAQVWNDVSDFDYIGEVYEILCKELRDGKLDNFEVPGTSTVQQAEDLPTHDE